MTSPGTVSLRKLSAPVEAGVPPTALAPMQDITTRSFMAVLHDYTSPDYYFTEYFRVHEHSRLEKHILESITDNPSDRPIFAQMIGESLPHFERTINELSQYKIAGIDLNLGCPAPKVYKKNVGGGLLRDPELLDKILYFLRDRIDGFFSVKMRLGFDDTTQFTTFLESIERNGVDMLTVHGRTVAQKYRGDVDYGLIKQAVQTLSCPVFANGNITSVKLAKEVKAYTGCHGLMIGRGAIRNPWIFRQIREAFSGREVFRPTLEDVRVYVDRLYELTSKPGLPPRHHLGALKKFLNFVAQGVDSEGRFLHDMRRARTPDHMLEICDSHLLGAHARVLYASEPYEGVIARPNCES